MSNAVLVIIIKPILYANLHKWNKSAGSTLQKPPVYVKFGRKKVIGKNIHFCILSQTKIDSTRKPSYIFYINHENYHTSL